MQENKFTGVICKLSELPVATCGSFVAPRSSLGGGGVVVYQLGEKCVRDFFWWTAAHFSLGEWLWRSLSDSWWGRVRWWSLFRGPWQLALGSAAPKTGSVQLLPPLSCVATASSLSRAPRGWGRGWYVAFCPIVAPIQLTGDLGPGKPKHCPTASCRDAVWPPGGDYKREFLGQRATTSRNCTLALRLSGV